MGRASVERLTHFRCGRCRGWFAIGDPPHRRTLYACPWCGTIQHFRPP